MGQPEQRGRGHNRGHRAVTTFEGHLHVAPKTHLPRDARGETDSQNYDQPLKERQLGADHGKSGGTTRGENIARGRVTPVEMIARNKR